MRAIGLWCYDKHRWVIGAWLIVAVAIAMAAGAAGGKTTNDFTLPGTESQRTYDLLQSKFPAASGDESRIVFHTESGTLEDKRADVEKVIAEVRKQPSLVEGPSAVSDPFEGTISKDGKTAFATITHSKAANDLKVEDIEKVIAAGQTSAAAKAAKSAGVQIEFGGNPVQFVEQNDQAAPIYELVGVAVAAVVLYVVLGSFSAMIMPLIAALLSIFIGSSIISIVSSITSVADFATQLATLISLGVGIDYGLLVLSRFRNERAKDHDIRTSVGSAVDTAGRSVLFAAITVVIALCGMILLGVSLLNWPALGAAIGVTLTMLATLTLVPALIGCKPLGRRVKVGDSVNPDEESHFWARYSRFAQRHPWKLGIAGLLILLVVASPVLNTRLASTDAGNGTPDKTSRKAYDLLTAGFGPGFNGPFLAAVELPPGGDSQADLAKFKSAYEQAPGVASVTDPVLNKAGDTATLSITPDSKPQDEATKDTLDRLRNEVAPPIEQETGAKVSIGGFTASSVDFAKVLSEKLPLFVAVVVGLSLLLLLVVFRSIAIPIKAGILNLLSIGTALGVITFVFQEGHFASLIGVHSTGPIEPFLPVIMFAIVFGLSMDYEVFLVTRMHEEWEHTKNSAYAVRHGMALTGKVVTAAALVMMSVFGAFMIGDDPILKLFGLGFAAAIFFDAFVIRLMVVPSVMFLLDKHTWWIPSWLDKALPVVSIEGPDEPEERAKVVPAESDELEKAEPAQP
ncbi:MAG TPA: MMPL family transporter [Baekduia sp.]|nr:MMPL family transporter [Baekduia sp.]